MIDTLNEGVYMLEISFINSDILSYLKMQKLN